jgi:predicted MPP superfamily phosphohydrolase
MLLAQKPDMVFFTGDLVNNEAKELNEYFDVFKKVKAPLGVYSTLGNHDYGDYIPWDSEEKKAKNLETLIAGHREMGWDILLDENRSIKLGGEQLGILGIQNWGLGGFKKKGDLKKALVGTEEYSNKLLLSHDPSHWRSQVLDKTDIDASFAGHTHGMQYGIEIGGFQWSPVQFRYKEWAGLYKENEQQIYVNRGFGFLGYPGRVGILPEITIFELKRA